MNYYAGSSMKMLAMAVAFGALPAFADSDLLVENVRIVEGAEAFEGFYLGLDALYGHVNVDHDMVSAGSFGKDGRRAVDGVSGVKKHRRCNIDPSLNFGFSRVINNWYMGIAADMSFAGNSNSEVEIKNTSGSSVRFTTKIGGVSCAVSAKGGRYFPKLKSVIYGFAGIKWRDVDCFLLDEGEVTSKAKLKRPAFLVGAGIEHQVFEKVTVSAEYGYSWRNSSDTTFSRDSQGSMFADMDQKLRDHTFKVGVKYHF